MNWGGEEGPFWRKAPPPLPSPNPTPSPPKTFVKVYGGTGGTGGQTLAHVSR